MTPLTIINAWICQVENDAIIPRYGDMTIAEGRVTKIDFRTWPEMLIPDENCIDAGARVILPPFINFHEHMYSRLAKGLPVSGNMDKFTAILDQLWWPLDRTLDHDMIKACARLAAVESLRHGVTYIFDHHASPNAAAGSLEMIASVLQTTGLRGVLCFETSDRDGHLQALEALAENERFIRQSVNADIKGMLGLHALFTLSDATLAKAKYHLDVLSTAIHIHLAEDRYDEKFSQDEFNISLIGRMQKFDLLSDRALLAHGIHLDPADLNAINQSGAAIVFNPDSNLNNAVGLPDYAQIPSGITLLTGTDGMHANIARSQKQLFLLYRMQGNSFDTAFAWLRRIWFDQFNFVRKWFSDYPALQCGDRADMILLDYFPPTPINPENFWGHYIYGMLESPVSSVIHQGKILVNQGIVLNTDQHQLVAAVCRQGQRLINKMEQSV